MRIGLLGGSFDPIHNAHLLMAKEAKKQLQLDEVWFVVTKDTPLKDRKLTSFKHRCNMVKMSIKAYRKFKLSTVEERFKDKSYTIDTIKYLKQQYPNNQFYFMIGQDQVAQLEKWKSIDLLEKEVQLCAFQRNNNAIDTKYNVFPLKMKNNPISSTKIRAGYFNELPNGVSEYILQHHLYLDFVKDKMSKYRYEHSQRVAMLCKEIAKSNQLDINKAYLCGILHDLNKEFTIIDKNNSEKILTILKPDILTLDPNIWHAYIGRYLCTHQLNIKDNDILLAIENHVLGECKNAYAMLLYVCDKLDPKRDYDTAQAIELCKHNLHKGYLEVKKQQEKFYERGN